MKIVVFNKPFDVLSQFREDEAHLTLSHFIHDPDLRLAGRLDLDSEGLMFLTDHGGLNQYITNPANKKYKTYLAQVDGDVTEEALEQLRKGVELADGMTLPAKAIKKWINQNGYGIVIHLYATVPISRPAGLSYKFVKGVTVRFAV